MRRHQPRREWGSQPSGRVGGVGGEQVPAGVPHPRGWQHWQAAAAGGQGGRWHGNPRGQGLCHCCQCPGPRWRATASASAGHPGRRASPGGLGGPASGPSPCLGPRATVQAPPAGCPCRQWAAHRRPSSGCWAGWDARKAWAVIPVSMPCGRPPGCAAAPLLGAQVARPAKMLLCCLLRAAHTPGGIPHPATPPLGALPTACALCTAIEALSFTIVDPSLPSFPPNLWRLRTPPAAALSVFGGYGAVQRGGVDVCVNAMVHLWLLLHLVCHHEHFVTCFMDSSRCCSHAALAIHAWVGAGEVSCVPNRLPPPPPNCCCRSRRW